MYTAERIRRKCTLDVSLFILMFFYYNENMQYNARRSVLMCLLVLKYLPLHSIVYNRQKTSTLTVKCQPTYEFRTLHSIDILRVVAKKGPSSINTTAHLSEKKFVLAKRVPDILYFSICFVLRIEKAEWGSIFGIRTPSSTGNANDGSPLQH